MENKLFRKESLDRISSPEQLNDYLRVTSPGIWLLLIAVIILLAGAFIWSTQVSIKSYINGTGIVKDNVLTITFDKSSSMPSIQSGMLISVGGSSVPVSFTGHTDEGGLIVGADTELPDGTYDAKVGYSEIQLLKLLFN